MESLNGYAKHDQTESHNKEFILVPGGLLIMAHTGRVLRNRVLLSDLRYYERIGVSPVEVYQRAIISICKGPKSATEQNAFYSGRKRSGL